eukprot:5482460-Amphidinium_carterae.1
MPLFWCQHYLLSGAFVCFLLMKSSLHAAGTQQIKSMRSMLSWFSVVSRNGPAFMLWLSDRAENKYKALAGLCSDTSEGALLTRCCSCPFAAAPFFTWAW